MKDNKHIERSSKTTIKIFDNRSLKVDYRTLEPILKQGMSVLDVGCGTGSISADIAKIVGNSGKVTLFVYTFLLSLCWNKSSGFAI